MRVARADLAELGVIVAASSLYRTAPVGGPEGQDDFLNAVLALAPRAGLGAEALLRELHELERRHGRVRRVRWEARVLDLDLLAWSGAVVGTRGAGEREGEGALRLPHPRMMERAFVLAPLVEIAPHWRHPVTGVRAADALARLPAAGVRRTDLTW